MSIRPEEHTTEQWTVRNAFWIVEDTREKRFRPGLTRHQGRWEAAVNVMLAWASRFSSGGSDYSCVVLSSLYSALLLRSVRMIHVSCGTTLYHRWVGKLREYEDDVGISPAGGYPARHGPVELEVRDAYVVLFTGSSSIEGSRHFCIFFRQTPFGTREERF